MTNKLTIALAVLGAMTTSAFAQTVTVVDCSDPANAQVAECAASDLEVPRFATNAGPLLLPLAALVGVAGLAGGGSDGTPSTVSTPSTPSTSGGS